MKTAIALLLFATSCAASEIWDVHTENVDLKRITTGLSKPEVSIAGDCVTFGLSMNAGSEAQLGIHGSSPVEHGVFRIDSDGLTEASLVSIQLYGFDERGFDIRDNYSAHGTRGLSHAWDMVYDAGSNTSSVHITAIQDVSAMTASLCLPQGGDANLDGQVTAADLNALAINWQSEGKWESGDFDASGFVDAVDLNLLAMNWQNQPAAAPVPEPTSLWHLVALFGLPICSRRKAFQRIPTRP